MKEDIEQMKHLRLAGLTYSAIGKLFGISRQRVHNLIPGVKPDPNLSNTGFIKFTNILKKAIKERDGYTCQKCGTTEGRIVTHHIDGDHLNNNPTNVITLCNSCHTQIREHGIHKGLSYAGE